MTAAKATRVAKVKARLAFSDAELATIRGFARAVWEECGMDVLQAVADERGKDINTVTVSRATAIEIALDAGRLDERLQSNPDLLARWNALDYADCIALVKPAFPHAREGM